MEKVREGAVDGDAERFATVSPMVIWNSDSPDWHLQIPWDTYKHTYVALPQLFG